MTHHNEESLYIQAPRLINDQQKFASVGLEFQTNSKEDAMEIGKFDDFDKALLAEVRAGRGTMRQLDTDASGLRAFAWTFCIRGMLSSPVRPPRVIADRLQALSGDGLIRFNGSRWVIV